MVDVESGPAGEVFAAFDVVDLEVLEGDGGVGPGGQAVFEAGGADVQGLLVGQVVDEVVLDEQGLLVGSGGSEADGGFGLGELDMAGVSAVDLGDLAAEDDAAVGGGGETE